MITEIRSNSDIEPCLSVVVPVYNEQATIEKVIYSILDQKPVRELVVVDDASNDGHQLPSKALC